MRVYMCRAGDARQGTAVVSPARPAIEEPRPGTVRYVSRSHPRMTSRHQRLRKSSPSVKHYSIDRENDLIEPGCIFTLMPGRILAPSLASIKSRIANR